MQNNVHVLYISCGHKKNNITIPFHFNFTVKNSYFFPRFQEQRLYNQLLKLSALQKNKYLAQRKFANKENHKICIETNKCTTGNKFYVDSLSKGAPLDF